MTWRDLWKSTIAYHGYEPPLYHLHPIAGSVLFICVTFFICSTLRRLNKAITPRPIQDVVSDFISSFQTCACSFENGNALRLYGWLGLYMIVFTMMMIYSNILTDSSNASPVGNFEKFFQRRQSFLRTVLKVSVQVFAGYLSFRYVKQFWSLDVHEYHTIRSKELCSSFLTVSVSLGVLLEAGATLTDVILSAYHLAPWKQVNHIMRCSLEAALILAGIGLTGMYFHPTMASAQTFGCKGTKVWEHILVYWVGPFIGSFVGVKINSAIRKAIKIERRPPVSKQPKKDSGRKKDSITNSHPKVKGVTKSSTPTTARQRNVKVLNNNNNNIK